MKYSRFLGGRMAQSPYVTILWEDILNRADIERIIEFGTFHGNFSLFLLLTCLRRGKEFYTYDTIDWRQFNHQKNLHNRLEFDKYFYRWDVFEHEKEIGEILKKPGITLLYCDNGAKEKEFNTFKKYLKSGDILGIHDWMTEVFPQNLDLEGMEEIPSEYYEIEKMTRFFKKL